ncbi:hypothetical protein TgHK011_003292 [Trichoderma gracile]|nr:hypothetical protein TgHK011_003292 [Trichoderma gracile]
MTKIKKEENHEEKSAPGPHENLFSRFMNQVIGSNSREMETAKITASTREHKAAASLGDDGDIMIIAESKVYHGTSTEARPDGLSVVQYSPDLKVEAAAPEQAQDNQGGGASNAGNAGPSESTGTGTQQVDGDVMLVDSSVQAPNESDDTQQSKENAPTSGALLNEKGQSVTSEKETDDMLSEKAVGIVKCDETQEVKFTVSSLDAEPTEDIDKQEREEHSSEKKHKGKRPHKRAKSGDHHAESSKRAKTSKTSILDDEAEITKTSGPGNHAKALGVEQARARIPTNCSIRHEHDQKEELESGKKLAKSKKYTSTMVSTLKDHQLTALSWMVQREKEFPRQAAGGIIGHEMGLGKTVTSLACIATNRPNKSERKKSAQATLVIVPSGKIARQWRDEARKHWTEEESQNVIVYSPASELGPKQYAKQRIVIATYAQLRNQYPCQEFMDALDRQYADDPRAHRREFRKEAKELYLVDWFRVIVDESHEMTKWNGRTLKACCAIEAQHHWALSGTPILNKPMEFYSYATFICCNFIGNRRVFKNDYITEDATNDYFDTIGSYLMYRRRQEEYEECKEKKGMPIFENEHGVDEVEDVMPELGKAGEKGKDSSARSIQSSRQLRLRQVLSHSYCLENFLMSQDYLDESEFITLYEELRSVAENKTVIEQLETDPDWQQHLGKYETGLKILKERKEVSLGGIFNMDSIMSLLSMHRFVKMSECGGSEGHSQDLWRYKCGHIYCSTCLSRLLMQRSNLPVEQQTGYMKCSVDSCGQDLVSGEPIMTLDMLAARARADKNYVEIGTDAIGTTVQPRNDSSAFFAASSIKPQAAIPPPGSRLTATLAVAMTWLTEAPQDKIIIFTQFIPTLKMLGYLFQILGVKFVYYSGALPKQKQDHAMNAFQNDPKVMVMISTMKSGGQSHNLTVANRVIIVDLWWNKMAEKQAISRVARMGQTKETFSVRIVTKHSMDDRVIEVQKVKEETVARMLQDDGHERTEVNDEALLKMFAPKAVEQEKSKKRKGVKKSVTDMIFKEESPE